MKQLINYCPVHSYEQEIQAYAGKMPGYLHDNALDGIELYVYQQEPYQVDYTASSVGVHLKYWPYWLDFWSGDTVNLNKNFSDFEEIKKYYSNSVNQTQWLQAIRNNIRAGLAVKPEYFVWHVSHCDLKEIFTFDFRYTDEQVIDATIEVFNSVCDIIPDDVTVLFENLWWPGLRLVRPEIVDRFFCGIKKRNVGIMLDTGHLLNTNVALHNESEAVTFICQTVDKLGMYKNYIKGMHLSCSLSGTYQKQSLQKQHTDSSMSAIMKHITSIDQHRIFKEAGLKQLIDFLQPDYLVHELFYDNLAELAGLVKIQQQLLKN